MAKKCELCGKNPESGHLISHSNIKTKRRFMPNLQNATLMVDGKRKRVQVCTNCLKTAVKKQML